MESIDRLVGHGVRVVAVLVLSIAPATLLAEEGVAAAEESSAEENAAEEGTEAGRSAEEAREAGSSAEEGREAKNPAEVGPAEGSAGGQIEETAAGDSDAPAEERLAGRSRGEMKIERGFFEPVTFTLPNSEPQEVYEFSGVSFLPEFEEAISLHPAALEEASSSLAWNGLGLAGAVVMLAGSCWLLADTLNDVDTVNSGRIPDSELNWGPVGVVVTGGVITLVASLIGNSHLDRAVEIYNENEAARRASLGSSAGDAVAAARAGR